MLNYQYKAEYCGLSKRTIDRYEHGKAPRWYQHLMKYLAGEIPGWPSFRFELGKVWTPAGQAVSANEVEHVRWMVQVIGEMRREMNRLEENQGCRQCRPKTPVLGKDQNQDCQQFSHTLPVGIPVQGVKSAQK